MTTTDPDREARLQKAFEEAVMDVRLIRMQADEDYLEKIRITDRLDRQVNRLARAAGVELPEYTTERKVVRRAS